MLLSSNCAGRKLDHKAPLKLLYMISYISIHACNLHESVRINFPQSFNVNGPAFFINTVITVRVILQHFINLFEIKILSATNKKVRKLRVYNINHLLKTYLKNGVSAKLFPPLNHISPHEFCFLNVKIPSFQEPQHHVIVIVSTWKQLVG